MDSSLSDIDSLDPFATKPTHPSTLEEKQGNHFRYFAHAMQNTITALTLWPSDHSPVGGDCNRTGRNAGVYDPAAGVSSGGLTCVSTPTAGLGFGVPTKTPRCSWIF